MVNIVCIASEPRLQPQLKNLVRDLPLENVNLQVLTSFEQFHDLYLSQPEPDPEPDPEPQQSSSPTTTRLRPLHLLLLTLEDLPSNWSHDLNAWMRQLTKANFSVAEKRTRIILLKYEDDGVEKMKVIHPLIDDLVFLPIERMVFLQKLELALHLPDKATPSFLFNQEVQVYVDLCKRAEIHEINDLGVALENPFRLTPGTTAHFYIPFEQGDRAFSVYAKVVSNRPHLTTETAQRDTLTYFQFFGVDRKSLSELRLHIGKLGHFQALIQDDTDSFLAPPTHALLRPEDQKTFYIGLIHSNPDELQHLKSTIEREIARVHVITESSLALFMHKYLHTKQASGRQFDEPKLIENYHLFQPLIHFTVQAETREFHSLHTTHTPEDLYLGFQVKDIFKPGKAWWNPFQSEEQDLILEDIFPRVKGGFEFTKILLCHDSESQTRALKLRFYKSSLDGHVDIEMTAAQREDLLRIETRKEKMPCLDMLIMESHFMPTEASDKLKDLTERARVNNLLEDKTHIPVILIAEESTRLAESWVDQPEIRNVFYSPIDTRALIFCLSETLRNRSTKYCLENLGWLQHKVKLHVGKKTLLESISEYGGIVRHPRPIQPGSFLFLRGSFFDSAPRQNLTVRFYHSETHPTEPDSYLCSFVYYGIGDQFLKALRKWIIERYAASKQT